MTAKNSGSVAALLLLAALHPFATPAGATEPATPEAAAKVLDLRTFGVMEGSVVEQLRSLGMLMYQAPAQSKAAYEFQRAQLVKNGWKELPGGHHSPGNDVGQFTKQGFVLHVSASDVLGDPKRSGWSHVSLTNSGNVPADKLPVPKGMKSLGYFHGQAMYLSDASVAETAESSRKLLLADGWLPYGENASDDSQTYNFKKNGIRVLVWTSKAPAQGNKTMLQYNTELLAADIPLFAEAIDPRYDDFTTSLRFSVNGEDAGPIVQFYQRALGEQGWKATTDQPITDDDRGTGFLVFRNSRADMMSLDFQRYTDKLDAKLSYSTAAEVAQQDRAAKLAAEKKRAAQAQAQAELADAAADDDHESSDEEMPKLPDSDDFGDLLDAAEQLSGEDLSDARRMLEAVQGNGNKAPAKTPPPVGKKDGDYKVPRIVDVPMPEGAGVEYDRVTRIVKVTSADDIATLAKYYIDGLTEKGWTPSQKPLVTDDAAILKFGLGNATLTIMARQEVDGTEATLTSKGMAWDSIPESRLATRKPMPPSEEDSPTDDDMPQKPKPGKMRYAANIPPVEQKQSGVSMSAAGKNIPLTYGVAFQAADGDDTKTEILLSTKPINVAKIVALLNNGQDGGDALGFDPCLKLRYDAQNKLSYLFLYAEGMSINLGGQGEDKIQSQLTFEEGRAKGRAKLVEPGKFFDREYNFNVAFDVRLIASTLEGSVPTGAQPPEVLGAEEYGGVPIPLVTTNRSSIGSAFRKTVEVQVPAPLAAMVDFYRRELTQQGWKEDAGPAKVTSDSATLAFSGSQGSLAVNLTKEGDDTRATITTRSPAKAKAAGIEPQPGKGRLILANAGEREAVIVINGQQYKVAAGKGAENPKDGVSLHVLPGNYTLSMKTADAEAKSEKIKISVGETWGVIATPVGGYIADQLY